MLECQRCKNKFLQKRAVRPMKFCSKKCGDQFHHSVAEHKKQNLPKKHRRMFPSNRIPELIRRYMRGESFAKMEKIFGFNATTLLKYLKNSNTPLRGHHHCQGDGLTNKVCSMCQAEKPLNEYRQQKTGRLGRTASCNECKKACKIRSLHAKKRWKEFYLVNKDRIRQNNRDYLLTESGRNAQQRSRSRHINAKLKSELVRQFVNDTRREVQRVRIAILDDGYIASLLNIPVEIAKPLIPAKRAQLKLYRALKKGNTNV